MIRTRIMAFAVASLLAPATLAQTAPSPPPAALERGERMFGSVSPEGRQILRQAMRDRANPEDRARLKSARDRIGTLLEADKLDSAALKRAMDDERQLVDRQHAQRQAAMLAAFQKLGVADRKAFAADARKGRTHVESRSSAWRKGAQTHAGHGRNPPPPPGEF